MERNGAREEKQSEGEGVKVGTGSPCEKLGSLRSRPAGPVVLCSPGAICH